MSIRHILEGSMKCAGIPNHYEFAVRVGIDRSSVCRMAHDEYKSLRIETVDQIQRVTGVPFDNIFEWYRMPVSDALVLYGKDLWANRLRPCPLCDGEAKKTEETLSEHYAYANVVKIQCTKCGCSVSGHGNVSKPGYADNSATEQRVTDRWNRRPK